MSYFNNHAHSEYSNAGLGFPDSTNKIKKLIDTAYELGLKGFALTDHECLLGHIQAWKYHISKEYEKPFKLALGNEIYLMTEEEYEANCEPKSKIKNPYYHFVLTALDTEGYAQIRKLSDRAWLRARMVKGVMRTPTYYSDINEIVGTNRGHLVASTACLGGYVSKKILDWKVNNVESCKTDIDYFLQWGIEIFGKDNFYLEIQPCKEDNTEQIIVNKTMFELSQEYGLKIIPTTDAHYLTKKDRFIHKTLLLSKDGDREVDEFYSTTYLMTEEELRDYLRLQFEDKVIDMMLNNSMEIWDKIQEYNLAHAPIIPEIPLQYIEDFEIKHLFKDWYDKYPYFKFYATEADYIHDKYFFYRIEKALQEKVVDKGLDIETYINRCNKEFKELKLISENFNSSMASYYSTFKNIVQIIWDSDSLSMCGRGSSSAYLTTYLLDITQIDPVPLGEYMPYWRHLK